MANSLPPIIPANLAQTGQLPDIQELVSLPDGEYTVTVDYSVTFQAEFVEVLVPVESPEDELVGIVQLTQDLTTADNRIQQLRLFLLGTLAAELLLGVLLALLFALNLERYLRRVTTAIYGIASGREWKTLPEEGPTEIRLLLRSFNTLIERLRMLEETRHRLLANLVHEVSRPIGALQSAIHALLHGADREPELRRELLEGMEAEVERLHPLLENLARLHDQVLGTLELDCQPTDLNEWLPQTVGHWREAAHAEGLHWQLDLAPHLPIVSIDRHRLAQVLGNLVSNAIKYTPSGGISISAGVESEGLWIRVSDTGLGIRPEEQKQIFDPFYRSHPGRRFPQGMGLGLTIAHDLTAAHGGRLEVESRPKEGSQFTIWLPNESIVSAPGSSSSEKSARLKLKSS